MATTLTKSTVVSVQGTAAAGTQSKTKTLKVSAYTGTRVTKTTVVSVRQSVTPTIKTIVVSVRSTGPTVFLGPNKVVEAGSTVLLQPITETAGGAAISNRQWKFNNVNLGSNTGQVNVGAPISRTTVTQNYTYFVTDQNGMVSNATIGIVTNAAPCRGSGGRPMIEKTGPATNNSGTIQTNNAAIYGSATYDNSSYGA